MKFSLFETVLTGFFGGLLFSFINIPLAWMLGPMMAVILWNSFTKREVCFPVGIRNAGLIFIGYTMGRPFTIETLRQITVQFPSMAAATLSTVLFSFFMGYITYKKAGVSLSTSLIGSVPGGLSQMTVLSEEIPNTDVTVVTFMQTMRVLAVVVVVPFIAVHGLAQNVADSAVVTGTSLSGITFYDRPWLAGIYLSVCICSAIIAYMVKLPTAFMLGPVIGTAILVLSGFTAPVLPPVFIVAAQICVGTYLGVNFQPGSLHGWKKVFPYILAGAIGVLVFSLIIGWILSQVYGYSLVTAFLGTAPGGIAEMGLTALSVNADLSVIIAYQMFRLLFILLVVPYILKWMFKVK